jgi:hypothetical protein
MRSSTEQMRNGRPELPRSRFGDCTQSGWICQHSSRLIQADSLQVAGRLRGRRVRIPTYRARALAPGGSVDTGPPDHGSIDSRGQATTSVVSLKSRFTAWQSPSLGEPKPAA